MTRGTRQPTEVVQAYNEQPDAWRAYACAALQGVLASRELGHMPLEWQHGVIDR